MMASKNEEDSEAEKAKKTAEPIEFWKLIVIITAPIILLPLPLIVHRVEAKCAYVILIMTTYWMTEAIPLSATALLPVPLYPLLGVESAADTAANYFKDTNFLIFGSLLMAVAVEVSGLQYRIALRILIWFGARPQWLILGFMITAGFLSMWISNTATCAMMMPIVIVVLEEILGHKKRLQMSRSQRNLEEVVDDPKSGVSIFDGTLTLEDLGICRAAALGVAFASSVGGIGALTGSSPNLILLGQLGQLYPKGRNSITFANWFAFGMPMQILFMIFGWLWLLLLFMGWRATFRCFARRTETDESLAKLLRIQYERLGPLRFDEAVIATMFSLVIVLWVFREPGFIPGWGMLFNDGFVSDSTPVIFASIILFAFPRTLKPFLAWRKRKIGDASPNVQQNQKCKPKFSLPSYQPIMNWRYMQEKFPWAVIILMGGGFALADGVKKSGLTSWLGCSLQSSLSSVHPSIVVLIFLTLMTAVSEFASNSATASIFVPILLTVAESLHINPLYFGLPAAVGSAFGFMLPVATPPNMIVFEKCKQLGILGAPEMMKAGLGLDIMCILIAFVAMHTTGNWVYQFNTYPDWAHSGVHNFTACT